MKQCDPDAVSGYDKVLKMYLFNSDEGNMFHFHCKVPRNYFEIRVIVNVEEFLSILSDKNSMILNSKHSKYGKVITFCLTNNIEFYTFEVV